MMTATGVHSADADVATVMDQQKDLKRRKQWQQQTHLYQVALQPPTSTAIHAGHGLPNSVVAVGARGFTPTNYQ